MEGQKKEKDKERRRTKQRRVVCTNAAQLEAVLDQYCATILKMQEIGNNGYTQGQGCTQKHNSQVTRNVFKTSQKRLQRLQISLEHNQMSQKSMHLTDSKVVTYNVQKTSTTRRRKTKEGL